MRRQFRDSLIMSATRSLMWFEPTGEGLKAALAAHAGSPSPGSESGMRRADCRQRAEALCGAKAVVSFYAGNQAGKGLLMNRR